MPLFSRDQPIIVTGASSGIGRACALKLNGEGAPVIASARNADALRQLAEECPDPENLHVEPFDLTADLDALPHWVTDMRKKYGRLYGLCHCAGVGRLDSIRNFALEDAKKHFDINFFAPLMLAKGFCDRRNFQKGGSMLFLSSASAVYPEKGHIIYGAAKAALICSIKSVAREMASLGLRANCIAPGLVRTPMLEEASRSLGSEYLPEQESSYLLGLGQPEDIAEMAAFLLSSKSRWITGQNFLLDGGRYL